jgi:hypothetical protein
VASPKALERRRSERKRHRGRVGQDGQQRFVGPFLGSKARSLTTTTRTASCRFGACFFIEPPLSLFDTYPAQDDRGALGSEAVSQNLIHALARYAMHLCDLLQRLSLAA